MPQPINTVAVYLIPGMQAKITALDHFIAKGSQLVRVPTLEGGYETQELIQGFYVANSKVGSIEAVPEEPAVIYTHKRFDANKVFFKATTGEEAVVDIISVPIHDHSSIVTGGPAYGTYFADDDVEDTKENT